MFSLRRDFTSMNPNFDRSCLPQARQAGPEKLLLTCLASVEFLWAVLGSALSAQAADAGSVTRLPLEASGLYSLTNVWTVHLKFVPEQWAEMEPKEGGGPFGGFGGPARFGGPPGGEG